MSRDTINNACQSMLNLKFFACHYFLLKKACAKVNNNPPQNFFFWMLNDFVRVLKAFQPTLCQYSNWMQCFPVFSIICCTILKSIEIKRNIGRKWVKVFKNGPSKICGRQSLKNLKWCDLLKQTNHFKFFKCCVPQILLGPFLNTLTQMA